MGAALCLFIGLCACFCSSGLSCLIFLSVFSISLLLLPGILLFVLPLPVSSVARFVVVMMTPCALQIACALLSLLFLSFFFYIVIFFYITLFLHM